MSSFVIGGSDSENLKWSLILIMQRPCNTRNYTHQTKNASLTKTIFIYRQTDRYRYKYKYILLLSVVIDYHHTKEKEIDLFLVFI